MNYERNVKLLLTYFVVFISGFLLATTIAVFDYGDKINNYYSSSDVNLSGKDGYYNGAYLVSKVHNGFRPYSVDKVLGISYHEIAHHQENYYLSSAQWSEYIDLYSSVPRVSSYAETSVDEGFAENFKIMSGLCYRTGVVDERLENYFVEEIYSSYDDVGECK